MTTFLTIVHVFSCVFLILLVLIQSGKGAEISASLGGSSQTIFGSSGGANFFTRATSILAGTFMATSLFLTIYQSRANRSLFRGEPVPATSGAAPAVPGNATGAAPATPAPGAPAAPAGQPPADPARK